MAYGFFERAFTMRGFENILVDMVEHPAFVDDLMDGHLVIRMRVFDLIAERIPMEGFFGGGDDCDQRGPIMGIERWRRFIKPRLAKMISHAHSLGKPLVAHMCGNVMPLVDDLMEIGLDALESLQPEAMDVYALKERTAGKMALIGGMGTQSTLPFDTPEYVRDETERLKTELGKGGGYVLGSAKPVMKDVPTANAVAFLEAAEGRLKALLPEGAGKPEGAGRKQ
jgi:uroporphyrinogen decarboxylase